MNATQLEIIPSATTAATKHPRINHRRGKPSWKSHGRPIKMNKFKNDAPWRFLVDDRAGCRARIRSQVEACDEQAAVKELIAKASTPENPHNEIRGGQSHELPKR